MSIAPDEAKTKQIAYWIEVCMQESLDRSHLTPSAHKSYRWILRKFADWIGPTAPLDCFTPDAVEEYLGYLMRPIDKGGYRPRSVHAHKNGLRFLHRWSIARKLIPAWTFPTVRLPHLDEPARHVTRPDNAISLLEAVETLENPYRRAMARAMLSVLNECSIRIAELLGIELDDLSLAQCRIVIHGKGNKVRNVYFPDYVVPILREYLALRPSHARSSRLWVHSLRRQVGDTWLYHLITELVIIAKIEDRKDCLPHAMRRGSATRKRRAGYDLEQLREHLGHTSLTVTQIYTRTDEEEQFKLRNTGTLRGMTSIAPGVPAPPAPLPAGAAVPSEDRLIGPEEAGTLLACQPGEVGTILLSGGVLQVRPNVWKRSTILSYIASL